MIQISHITKHFDAKAVLQDINATFQKGKVNLIIGKSGSGKTVLLKTLIGLITADTGTINYDGTEITGKNTKNMTQIRKEMGVVFQGGALFDSLNVLDNITFPLTLFSTATEKEKQRKAHSALQRVDLRDVARLYPSELSGGMKKRVAIARAIVHQPKYLFCDEPNSGLDPLTATLIDNLLSEITHENNITAVINTHDMNSVFEIGEHITFIHQGRKQWEGNRQEILQADDPALDEFLFTSKLNQTVKRNAK
ncbi:MAG: ATP-binding cassette domain-containing protein [Odoribacteraceae bacterium]|jgi:phospholipid/cholesterol/gamma-HCH transport system ATP-binding protein|nr:ATP-binding cassette domain-containing protein [Odoribacteraceae bacterium]